MTADIARLDFARKLGELLDVPLVACPPGGKEFIYPEGDRDSLSPNDNRNQLGKLKPSWAVMARTGVSVAVVDVDPRNGSDIDKTRQLLDGLNVRIFAEIATPSGGRHFYIAGHPELPSCSALNGWPGIDILSFGKLVFLPGTQRPKYGGVGYQVIFDDLEALADGGDPDGAEAFSNWVAELRGDRERFETSPPWPGGEPDARQAQYLAKMLAGIHRDLSAMGKDSGRNTAVYNKALRCGNFIAGAGLDGAVAADVLLDASRQNGLVQEDGERSVLASIGSGIKNGKVRPRAVPEAREQVEVLVLPKASANGSAPDDTESEPAQPITYTATDDGNALRLITKHGHQFRRVADMRRWFVWNGMRWAQDHEDRAVRGAARELGRQLPGGSDAADRFKRISMSATGLSGCVRVAETDTRVSILAGELDAHPELINTPSGVVDLRTGAVKPHDPALLLTRITAYGVDLNAPHPRWDAFLAETFQKDGKPDQELIGYMQRLAGLALLGNVREHILPFLHGTGANGKGVFTLVLQGIFGDADTGGYALSAPDGFLMSGREGKHETEMARLRGARFVVCSEQTSGKRFDESKVKRLTGGDVLTGRFMRGDFFDFVPSHLTWVLSNHLPAVREGGPSFWRRVRKIPFLHVVPEGQRIPDLHDQLLAEEGPAILGWMVRGAVEVIVNGLNDPESVVQATLEYEISEDSLASFIRDECLLGQHFWVETGQFRERYFKHCDEMGLDPKDRLSAKALTMRLVSEFGITEGKLSRPSRRTYKGITLQAEDVDE
jgi:P4 family phage/plasmid primase-like protien